MDENTNNNSGKSQIPSSSTDSLSLVEKKLGFFNDVIQKTIISVHKNKETNILGMGEVTMCMNSLTELSVKIKQIYTDIKNNNTDNIIDSLQFINNELSGILKVFGTDSLDDLLVICFGSNSSVMYNEDEQIKYELLKKYFRPLSYKVLNFKKDGFGVKKGDSLIDVTSEYNNMYCMDLPPSTKPFHKRVFGMCIYVHHQALNKDLIITGITENIVTPLLRNTYLDAKIEDVMNNCPTESWFSMDYFKRFVEALSLKDILILDRAEIYSKYVGFLSISKTLGQKNLSQIVKDFVSCDSYGKRTFLIQYLIGSSSYENKYVSYLLYDLITADSNGTLDSVEQTMIFDSFPWTIKQYFRDAMKCTIEYTNNLKDFDMNKIPLEQQICLLKADETVKEKAMTKLKEVKSKSEDSGSKARQYLDGLLKIPFGVFKKEPILNVMDNNRVLFNEIMTDDTLGSYAVIPKKDMYTSMEMVKYGNMIYSSVIGEDERAGLKKLMVVGDKTILLSVIETINNTIDGCETTIDKLQVQSKTKTNMKKVIISFIDDIYNDDKYTNIRDKLKYVIICDKHKKNMIMTNTKKILDNFNVIGKYIKDVKGTLDKSIHGHNKAKEQIQRIVGQWVNGKQDGYCFGFEGPPGVGKTSIAVRGIANCLLDDDGNSRPFAFIQMGGDANGSTLHGHNYTYVGSTWGSIVQILIDKKCLNPIIFIDEVDKISRTEHGREIVGILTHLLDPTQNDSFQDKYFNGIDLDLSKALFILSYNDVDAIDRILLDRIHRIKFENLSIDDKLVISNEHILPEVFDKMGLKEMIHFDDDVLKFIIENYTYESGVRKLKEKLFEIVGEVNLDILKNGTIIDKFPINITIDDVKNKYFKDKQEVVIKQISKEDQVGVVNGMWANTMGHGGTLPIKAKFFPCDKFLDLKLTGLQEQVMRESMHVAETLAWSLTTDEEKKMIQDSYDTPDHKCGIHIHTGDGSVKKDGPSGGAAITTVLYSLLTGKKIRHEFALTGEIDLHGEVTKIGGLDSKMLGSIKAGVTSFIYPKENEKDFKTFMEKYKDDKVIEGISFYPAENIQEVFDLLLV